MNSLALRAILVGLLIAALAGKIWRPHAAEPDFRAAVTAVTALEGWSAYDKAGRSPDTLGTPMYFQVPGCDGVVQVFSVNLNLQLSPLLDQLIMPGYMRRFVYMGRTWLTEDRLGMRLEWLKYKALSLLGLGRYAPSATALVVAKPPGCHQVDKVDWSPIWEKRTQVTRQLNGISWASRNRAPVGYGWTSAPGYRAVNYKRKNVT
jgi:hypothetical protein